MNKSAPGRKSRLTRALGRLRLGRRRSRAPVADSYPSIPVSAGAVRVLSGPAAFRDELLERIARAERRIILVALYLQDDAMGRRVMDALYAAVGARPSLRVLLIVDRHRAQRGLLGQPRSPGNARMYREYAARFGDGVQVLGVPVQSREIFGVLHLKGFVIDDTVLYSGASINDVYLAASPRYRLDRYHVIDSPRLAGVMADFVEAVLVENAAVTPLNRLAPRPRRLRVATVRAFRRDLRRCQYLFQDRMAGRGDLSITPLAGFGAGNALNETILALVKSAERRLLIYTPYFNPPPSLRRALSGVIRAGRSVTIVVGDKTANDFFIPVGEPFRTNGLLPYLYEGNLRRFAKAHRGAIADRRLNIFIWRHGDNTFHPKGLLVDDRHALLTGSNLNPRSWTLDLENGLLIRDLRGLLAHEHARERATILKHATRLADFRDLETPADYPPQVRRALEYLDRARIDRLLNRLL